GRVQQVDTPINAYRRPRNRFVAEFIGTANIFEGQVADGSAVVLADGRAVPCAANGGITGRACVVVRPEHLQVLDDGAGGGVPASVVETVYFGQSVRVHLRTDDGVAVVAVSNGEQVQRAPGQRVALSWAPEHAWLMAA